MLLPEWQRSLETRQKFGHHLWMPPIEDSTIELMLQKKPFEDLGVSINGASTDNF